MMKFYHLNIYFILFINCFVIGQKDKTIPENFSVDKNRIVVWQKVYESDIKQEQLLTKLQSYFESTEFTRGLELMTDTFKGYSGELKVKPIKGGEYYNPITAFLTIDVKDYKYRVTLKDIKYKEMNVGLNMGMLSVNQSQSVSFEDLVLKSGKAEFKTNFIKINFLESYNTAFENIFTLTDTEIKVEGW